MRKQTKIAAVVSAAALLALGASMTSFAASKGTWMMVDGEWYCYDKNGDAYENTFCSSNGKEYYVGEDGQLVRSAGNSAQLMAKEGKYATLRLPSGEMRMVPIVCRATIGVVGNGDHSLINLGKAGRKRHMGIRPTVRGSVMNPNDHPHGGGEGKAPVGRPGPCTPWGKPALGLKTRKKNKQSNKLIVRRRDGRAIK